MEAAGAKRSLLNLPAGYHFEPTEEELIVHYLRRKIAGDPPLLPIFKHDDVVSCSPEQITEKHKDCGPENRWYFFTRRVPKYKSGNRPNRTTPDDDNWKATGPQKLIYSGKDEEKRLVGRMRTLVFYDAPPEETDPETGEKMNKGQSKLKTSWTMREYENLNSEAEAADKSADKLAEWVLCTIQEQKNKKAGDKEKKEAGSKEKREAGKEGSKVKETKGKGKIKAGSNTRKGKQHEEIQADKGTDQDPIQAGHLMKRRKVPMPSPHPKSTVAPEEGDMMGMFVSEYHSFPRQSSPMPTVQQDESPLSEIPPPFITDDNSCYGPNMAPAPCLQEPPPPEMTSTFVGGNYNVGSAISNMMPCHESPLLEVLDTTRFAGNTYVDPSMVPPPLLPEAPHMETVDDTPSSFLGYNNYHNIDPSMATATYYPHHSLAFACGGAVQNVESHYWYHDGDLASIVRTGSSGFNFAGGSSQYQGGPSVPGPGTAVVPAAPLQWQASM